MLTIKSLTSGVAAAALVSVIGLAYAQTTTTPQPSPSDTTQMPTHPSMPAVTEGGTTSTPAPATGSATPSSNNDGTMPEPKADRN